MRITVKHVEEQAHEDGAWSCCWVPGTDSILTGAVDESVKKWSCNDSGLQLEKCYDGLAGYTLGVVSVAADPTGEWAASSALDSYIRVWSLKDHQEKALLESMPTEVWSATFSPHKDKCILAASGGTSGKIKLWDITAMQPGAKTDAPAPVMYDVPKSAEGSSGDTFVLSIAFSPDGKSIACGCMDGQVAVFDVETRQLKNTLIGHFKPVRSVAFTPDSQQILSACDDMHVHLYESSGNLVEAFSGHESWVLSVAAHPDGMHFASASSDGRVKLWDIPQRTCIMTSAEHKDQVWSVAFNDEGTQLASCGDDGQLSTYNVL